ncbi:MAG: YicC family protein [Bacteroidetes bacterium]|nr:YicC family protein [Bacteroidota bacterium]
MIRSMTGFGTAAIEFQNKTITVEIKSVNSKFMDLGLRLPSQYKEKEMEVRTEFSRLIERGKAEVSISVDSQEALKKTNINHQLVKAYFEELSKLDKELGLNTPNFLQIILPLPEVLSTDRVSLNEEEWKAVYSVIIKAEEAFQNFRKEEGKALQRDLEARINSIRTGLKEIETFEGGRIDVVRKRLQSNLEEFIQVNNIDRNRFEQELIFYIEKFDISEEKVRLTSHCDYFIKTMKSDPSAGKKLSFIAQEIGREINTIGSKANDADMQKAVVVIKDELEKIKEQVLNVL